MKLYIDQINISEVARAAVSVCECCDEGRGRGAIKGQPRSLSWSSKWSEAVSPACGELRHLWSLTTPAQYSLFIWPSLTPSSFSSANYSWALATTALSHSSLLRLALMSLSTPKSRGPSLNRAEGDYVTACLWGWNIFFYKNICLIHTLFYYQETLGYAEQQQQLGSRHSLPPITVTWCLILLLFHFWEDVSE